MKQSNQHIVTLSFNFHAIVLIFLAVPCSSADKYYDLCAPQSCGAAGPNISYPFRIPTEGNSYCGYPGFEVYCSGYALPLLHLHDQDYVVQNISYENSSIRLYNAAFYGPKNGCFPLIMNYSIGSSPFIPRNDGLYENLHFLSECNMSRDLERYKVDCGNGEPGLVMFGGDEKLEEALEGCGRNVVVAVESEGVDQGNVKDEYEDMMKKGFELSFVVSDCSECKASGGRCGYDLSTRHFQCFCTDRPHSATCKPKKSKKTGLIIGSVGGILLTLVICGTIFIIWRQKKRNKDSSYLLSRNMSSDPSLKDNIEVGSGRFLVPVYTYAELEKATDNFDSANELGDGGFGIVYYGRLKDGREVAVKRLYEHNYKRMEHFMNEINILRTLRHPNLVTLYGCTSRHSRELLLVYEYIQNGTVADHIHGNKAEERLLTWPIRLNIALETANALAHLHKSDIIHRDVKTNNILLDRNFSVKVADFGLSRLFPLDATHISTAPQGTPGYVDPEYHECYQLTDKSDVYSFGVVLVELISSLPAVDITRHRHEINLSNLAISRIQTNALGELIDSSLGYGSDPEVTRMTSDVAELAFRCLQSEKEMRPSMDEVVDILEAIKRGPNNSGVEKGVGISPSPESDGTGLLKNRKLPHSPLSVTEDWVSGSSTASV